MATLTKGKTFGSTEQVTSAKLHALIDDGTCTAIVNADVDAAAAIVGSKLNLATPGIIGAGTPAAITGTTITGTSLVGPLTGTASLATSLTGGAGGTIPYQSSANTTAMLANGSAGEVLTSAGTTAAPTWEIAGVTSPAGAVTAYVAAAAPAGWLLCNGASVLRASYAALDAIMADVGGVGNYGYGSVDGTHFNVPDMIGRVVVGLDASDVRVAGADALADTGGDADSVAAHVHEQSKTTGSGSTVFHTAAGDAGSAAASGVDTQSTGTADGNLPPYLTMNYIIKT